jgi:hypothetical protein
MRVEHSLLETATTLSKEKVRGLQADLANQDKLVHSFEDGIGDVQVTTHGSLYTNRGCLDELNKHTCLCVFSGGSVR